MENIEKYIGIYYGWKSKYRMTCLDLCRQWYIDHGYKQNFDDGKIYPKSMDEFNKSHRFRLMKYFLRNFTVTKDSKNLNHGDIVAFNINGDMHFGMYLENDTVLAMQVPCIEGVSQSTVYKRKFWNNAFVCGFKR